MLLCIECLKVTVARYIILLRIERESLGIEVTIPKGRDTFIGQKSSQCDSLND